MFEFEFKFGFESIIIVGTTLFYVIRTIIIGRKEKKDKDEKEIKVSV
jgi:hypothetical protein